MAQSGDITINIFVDPDEFLDPFRIRIQALLEDLVEAKMNVYANLRDGVERVGAIQVFGKIELVANGITIASAESTDARVG